MMFRAKNKSAARLIEDAAYTICRRRIMFGQTSTMRDVYRGLSANRLQSTRDRFQEVMLWLAQSPHVQVVGHNRKGHAIYDATESGVKFWRDIVKALR